MTSRKQSTLWYSYSELFTINNVVHMHVSILTLK